MQVTQVLTNFFFGVVLPTADVVTDFIFAIKLLFGFTTNRFTGKSESHPIYGIAMLCPILFSMTFIFYQWYQIEYKSTTKSKVYKILTCIMVMVQFYPQFKTLEIIWYGYWRRDPEFNWKEEKVNLMLNIGSLEPILESVIQMHIVLCIFGLRWEILYKDNYNPFNKVGFFDSLEFFIFTFTLSVVSASKGLTDFLLHGPCKLLPTTGKIDGMGTIGYLLLFLNIAATMVAKGVLLIFVISFYDIQKDKDFQKLVFGPHSTFSHNSS